MSGQLPPVQSQIRQLIQAADEAQARMFQLAPAAAELLCRPGALQRVGPYERMMLKQLLRNVDGRSGRWRA